MIAIEYEIVQNSALGASTLWHFVKGFNRSTNDQIGPTIIHLLPTLPIAFNEEAARLLYRRHFDGGLYSAIADDRGIFVGLQLRMESMVPQTYAALNLAISTGLLKYDGEKQELFTVPRKRPPETTDVAIKRLFSTADRLGYWLARLRPEEIGNLLRIQF